MGCTASSSFTSPTTQPSLSSGKQSSSTTRVVPAVAVADRGEALPQHATRAASPAAGGGGVVPPTPAVPSASPHPSPPTSRGSASASARFDAPGVTVSDVLQQVAAAGIGAAALRLAAGRALLRLGEPLSACEVLEAALSPEPSSPSVTVALRRVMARALFETGAAAAAVPLLEALRAAGHWDTDTAALLASCYQDVAATQWQPAQQDTWLHSALALWEDAFALSESTSVAAGVHAASLKALLGMDAEARNLAVQVMTLGSAQLPATPGSDAAHATTLSHLAAACVVLSQLPRAAEFFTRATAACADDPVALGRMHRDMRLVLQRCGCGATAANQLFRCVAPPPGVGVLLASPPRQTGGSGDGNAPTVSPPAAVAAAVSRVMTVLLTANATSLYVAPTSVVEVAVAEAWLRAGRSVVAVLPVPLAMYLDHCPVDAWQRVAPTASVPAGAGSAPPTAPTWRQRVEAVVSAAVRVQVANDLAVEWSTTHHHYGSLVLNGLADMRAAVVEAAVARLHLRPRRVLARPEALSSAAPVGAAVAPPSVTSWASTPTPSGAGVASVVSPRPSRRRSRMTGVVFDADPHSDSDSDTDGVVRSDAGDAASDRRGSIISASDLVSAVAAAASAAVGNAVPTHSHARHRSATTTAALYRSPMDATVGPLARAAVVGHGRPSSALCAARRVVGPRAASAAAVTRQPHAPPLTTRSAKPSAYRFPSDDGEDGGSVAAGAGVGATGAGAVGSPTALEEASLPPVVELAAVEQWRQLGLPVHIVAVDVVQGEPPTAAAQPQPQPQPQQLVLPPPSGSAEWALTSPQLSSPGFALQGSPSAAAMTTPLEYTMSVGSGGSGGSEHHTQPQQEQPVSHTGSHVGGPFVTVGSTGNASLSPAASFVHPDTAPVAALLSSGTTSTGAGAAFASHSASVPSTPRQGPRPVSVPTHDEVVSSLVAAADRALGEAPMLPSPAASHVSAFASRPATRAGTGGASMASSVLAPPTPPPAPTASRQVVAAMLFADVVGYSKLGDQHVKVFVAQVLGTVRFLIDSLPRSQRPVVRNTWGDALYFVFRRVDDAAVFALMLADVFTSVHWPSVGLPPLGLRISLHAAPVHVVPDPITNTVNMTGAHTSRAARIEPVTPPGCVYCSEAFAAIAHTLNVSQFRVSFVGTLPLAKGYGRHRIYAVAWTAEPPQPADALPRKPPA